MKPLEEIRRPHMLSASDTSAIAAATSHSPFTLPAPSTATPDHREWSASVLEAMLMVAYLDRPSVANRPLDAQPLHAAAARATAKPLNAAA